jgi:hypothetical protein
VVTETATEFASFLVANNHRITLGKRRKNAEFLFAWSRLAPAGHSVLRTDMPVRRQRVYLVLDASQIGLDTRFKAD